MDKAKNAVQAIYEHIWKAYCNVLNVPQRQRKLICCDLSPGLWFDKEKIKEFLQIIEEIVPDEKREYLIKGLNWIVTHEKFLELERDERARKKNNYQERETYNTLLEINTMIRQTMARIGS